MTALLPFVFSTLALFVLGLIFGSFLNVVIYRSIAGKNWLTGRSECDHCGSQIRWFDNIPLVSFIILRGRCRDCHGAISLTHPVVELLTASLFVWWYWFGALFFRLTLAPFQTLQPLFWLMVGVILLMIALADYLYLIIPDLLVGLLTLLTLAYRLALVLSGQMQVHDLLWAGFGALLFSGLFFGLWWLTAGRGFGFGDVKLIIPLALLMGWPKVVVGVFLAFIFGAIVGVVLIALGRKQFGQTIPFGPFLIIGTITALLIGQNLIDWYMSLLLQ